MPNCQFCNKEFKRFSSQHKYCSKSCKEKRYRVKRGYKVNFISSSERFYDKESHRLVAIYGNVRTTTEWRELYSRKILPNGCKASPFNLSGGELWKEFINADSRPLKEIMDIVGKNDRHHYDLETPREFAIKSGIKREKEWEEIARNDWLPDGIYHNPSDAFKDPDSRKKKNNERKLHNYPSQKYASRTAKEKRKAWRAANYRRKRELAMRIKYRGENRDAT